MAAEELDIDNIGDDTSTGLWEAIDKADRVRQQITWLTYRGMRIAAIVPVDVAQAAEEAIDDLPGTHVAEDLGLRRPWQEAGSGWQSRPSVEQTSDRLKISAIAAELSREHSFSERVELTTELMAIYDRKSG